MSDCVLQVTSLKKSFRQGDENIHVLCGIDFSLYSGKLVALVGSSGAGKSTLLHMAGLLDVPSSGSIIINGHNASGASDSLRTKLRAHNIGFVYQFHHLLPEFTAIENVMVPLMINGLSTKDATKKSMELLDQVSLSHRYDHVPGQLSGGEQQRVAIVRALSTNPALLLADEPTGNLDEKTSKQVFNLLKDMVRKQGAAALIATHDMSLAHEMDHVLRLHNGMLIDSDDGMASHDS